MALMTKAGRILLITTVAAVLACGLQAGSARALEPGAPAPGGPVPAASGALQPAPEHDAGERRAGEDGTDQIGLLGVAALLLFLFAGSSRRDRHSDCHQRSRHGPWRD